MGKSDWVVLLGIFLLSAITVGAAAWFFLGQKNYDFIVEATCNPSESTCFERDCSNPDDCPLNGLEQYRVFRVRAADFATCADSSCLNECVQGTIACTEIMCGDSEEDTCASTPEPPSEEVLQETPLEP